MTRLRYLGTVNDTYYHGKDLYRKAVRWLSDNEIKLPAELKKASKLKRLIWMFENVRGLKRLQVFKEPRKVRKGTSLFLTQLDRLGFRLQRKPILNKKELLVYADYNLDIDDVLVREPDDQP